MAKDAPPVYGNLPERDASWSRSLDVVSQRLREANAIQAALNAVSAEVNRARAAWPRFNSAHEGNAVLLEEVDELWEHVKTKQKNRDLAAMRKEALQVAAMAIRFATEVCDEERGRK